MMPQTKPSFFPNGMAKVNLPALGSKRFQASRESLGRCILHKASLTTISDTRRLDFLHSSVDIETDVVRQSGIQPQIILSSFSMMYFTEY